MKVWVLVAQCGILLCLASINQANPRLQLPQHHITKRMRRESFFGDIEDPFRTMRRSFQGLTDNVGRSMQTFMSVISSSMKSLQAGLIRRAPKQISFSQASGAASAPSYGAPDVSYSPPEYAYAPPPSPVHQEHNHVVNPDCDCTEDGPFVPVEDNHVDVDTGIQVSSGYLVDPAPVEEEYGSPQSPVISEPAQNLEEYGSPLSPVISDGGVPTNEEYGAPQQEVISAYEPAPTPTPGAVYQPVPTINAPEYQPAPPSPVNEYQPPSSNEAPIANEYQPAPAAGNAPEYTFQPEGGVATVSGQTFTTTPLYELPEHLSDEEICAHLRSLKEDIHKASVVHPGGSNHIDLHKLESIGVHSEHQVSSAVVPDQRHPEKYISVDCDNIKKIVNHNLWYIDTKPLKHNLHGHNRVRENKV